MFRSESEFHREPTTTRSIEVVGGGVKGTKLVVPESYLYPNRNSHSISEKKGPRRPMKLSEYEPLKVRVVYQDWEAAALTKKGLPVPQADQQKAMMHGDLAPRAVTGRPYRR